MAIRLAALLLLAPASRAGLIAYWNFDEDAGTVAADTSGSAVNHDGTLAAGGTGGLPVWIPGRFGSALDFNRVDNSNGSRVTVPNHPELLLNGAWTLSFWYRPGPNIGTYPGPMRIGTQGADTGSNIGWGFFRGQASGRLTFKRAKVQPNVFPVTLTLGQWYHVVMRHDGNNANLSIMFGVSTNTLTQVWPDCNTTTIFEFGRMDQFDDCDLDDVAFFDEALPVERIYTLHNVHSQLGLDYSLGDVRALWAIFDAGPGASGVVQGLTWSHTGTLPGTHAAGEAFQDGANLYVALTATSGVTASLTSLSGTYSPNGVGAAGTGLFAPDPMTFDGATLVFDLGGDTTEGGGVNDLIEVAGALNLVNDNTLAVNPLAPLANGTYRLLNYGGTLNGAFNPAITHHTRYSFTLDAATAGEVNLDVSGQNSDLRWMPTANGDWDLTSPNWEDSSAAPDTFFQADQVTFDDAGSNQPTAKLALDVYPASVTVDSSSTHYTFNGPGRIGGAGGLTKNGSSTLLLNTANTFSGPVALNAGTLRMGSPDALGSTNGGTTIAEGAMLDLAGKSPGAEPVTMAGAGLDSTGAVINTGAAILNNGLRGTVTLTGDTTLGGVNRWDIYGGALVGNGHKLTKTGPPEIALSHLGDTGLGDIDVLQGQLTVLGNTTLGDPAKPVVVSPGATFAHWASGATVHNKPVRMDSARMLNNTTGGADVATNTATVTLNGTNTFEGASSIALEGIVGGTGSLRKAGSGRLFLAGANEYTGDTTVANGRLTLLPSGSIASSANLVLQSGGVLDVSAQPGFALAAGQTLWGSGSVQGSVTAGTGSVITPGLSTGTLTITNGLNLVGGARLEFELTTPATEGGGVNDLISVGGDLSLSGTTTLAIIPAGPLDSANPYTLISYAGALSGGALSFNATSESRMHFAVDTTAIAGKVLLTVSGAAETLEWRGGQSGAETIWDLKTTPNWAGTTVPDLFYFGDTVVFNDLATEFTVDLVGNLYPANIRVGSTANYTFAGTGRLRGGGLTKSLGGTLTFANTGPNDYPGPTVIEGGTVQVGTGGAFGSLGPGTITNQGTLVLNRSDDLTLANTMVGAGALVKHGSNVLSLGAGLAQFDGSIAADGGLLRPTAVAGLGTTNGGTAVSGGATLELNGLNYGAEPVTASGAGVDGNGAIVNSAGGQNNALRFVTLAGDTTFGGSGRWDIRSTNAASPAALSTGGNGYSITKVGANQVSIVNAAVDPALGDINLLQGVLSVEGSSEAGDPARTLTIAQDALLQFWGRSTGWTKVHVLQGGRNIYNGSGAATMSGPVTLNGDVTIDSAGTSLTVAGVIDGPGSLTKIGGAPLTLLGESIYLGGTTNNAGNLLLGNGGTSGSVVGPIFNLGGLYIHRSDALTLVNPISGPGSVYLRTPAGLTVDGTASMAIEANIEVGRDVAGVLNIVPGAVITAGRINLGNVSGTQGDVVQLGGDVTVTIEARIGHWPNNLSSYTLSGGTLTLTGDPAGSTATEKPGILYIGVDGTGVFTQDGGEASAHGIVLDNRGETTGTDTLDLRGGRFTLGASGIGTGGNNANTTYAVNLGGATLASSASWLSPLAMTFTASNGNLTVDTAAYTNELSGALTGDGGLVKTGSGTLVIAGAGTFNGDATVAEGTLLVRGTVGSGSGFFTLQSGATLEGTGTIGHLAILEAGSVVAPGPSLGTLSFGGEVHLEGTAVMEITKSGATLANDQLVSGAAILYGGTLTVLATGDPLGEGDSFTLFDAPSRQGAFATVNLPPLSGGLVWDVSQLAAGGTIRVASGAPPQPTILPVRLSGTNLVIQVESVAGFDYVLEGATNLNLPILWTPVSTNRGDGTILTFEPPLAPGTPEQYYRFVVRP